MKKQSDKTKNISKKQDFADRKIKCVDCGEYFIFSASEQKFYKSKKFGDPKRCKSCREKNKKNRQHRSYAGLEQITRKMGTNSGGFFDHAETYGAGFVVGGWESTSHKYK